MYVSTLHYATLAKATHADVYIFEIASQPGIRDSSPYIPIYNLTYTLFTLRQVSMLLQILFEILTWPNSKGVWEIEIRDSICAHGAS